MAEAKEYKNVYQGEHEHTCPECGGKWKCRLALAPDLAEKVSVEVKGRKPCWSDVSPLCAKCVTPEKIGMQVCKCGAINDGRTGKKCLGCSGKEMADAEFGKAAAMSAKAGGRK
jgi:hypothetical protein